jgi:hypothetical protein
MAKTKSKKTAKIDAAYLDNHAEFHNYESWARNLVQGAFEAAYLELEKKGGELEEINIPASIKIVKSPGWTCVRVCYTIPIINKEFCIHQHVIVP